MHIDNYRINQELKDRWSNVTLLDAPCLGVGL